jgi:putative DNA primase/helicase
MGTVPRPSPFRQTTSNVEAPPKPPKPKPPIVKAIPAELRERPQWIVWRYEDRAGRRTKVLYDPIRRKSRAKANDPLTWASFDEAMAAFNAGGFDGIGYVFSEDDPYFGADLDECLRDGEVLTWAAPIVAKLPTFGEVSPSGTGIKFIGRGKIPPEVKAKYKVETGTNRRNMAGDGTGALEVYDCRRYFTITGNVFNGQAAIADLPGVAAELFLLAKDKPGKTRSGGRRRSSKPAPDGDAPPTLLDPPGAGHSDDDVLRVAGDDMQFNDLWAGRHSFGSPSEADMSLCNRLASLCGPGQHEQVRRLFLRSELGKRDKAHVRTDYLDRTIAKAYEGRTEYYQWAPQASPAAAKAPSLNGEVPHHPATDVPNLTELGNARRLIAAHGSRLRYSKPIGLWFEWDESRWRPDQRGAVWQFAKDTVRQLGHEAAEALTDQRRQATLRWALKSEEKKVIAAMIELAWSEPGIPIMPDALDADPWLLNTPSGTVMLNTGKLRPHRQEDLISKSTTVPFDPKAECPRWEKTLLEIFADDQEMVAYAKRALGYSLTGVIGEHALFLCYGTGRNGKNTVLDTVHAILGDYATIANPRTFLSAGQNDHLAMVADLMGRRFVPTDEVEEGEQLAESMVKRLTGNKVLKARFMRQNPFEFPVLFKIWMPANYKPEIQGQDEGIWSRIRVIPFEVYFPPEKRIKGLSDILVAEEGPGILRWLVEGSVEWHRIGLAEPQKVLNAIKAYRSEQNVLMDFLGRCAESYLENETLRLQVKVETNKLYARYVAWCKDNGEKNVLTSRKFGLKLTPLGYQPYDANGTSYRLGLKLKGDAKKGCNDKHREEPGK